MEPRLSNPDLTIACEARVCLEILVLFAPFLEGEWLAYYHHPFNVSSACTVIVYPKFAVFNVAYCLLYSLEFTDATLKDATMFAWGAVLLN